MFRGLDASLTPAAASVAETKPSASARYGQRRYARHHPEMVH